MPNTAAKTVEAQQKQSQASKRATLDQLVGKAPSTTEFSIYFSDGNGGSNELTLKYRAIGMRAYDKLVSEHPPRALSGRRVLLNLDTFAPALIAACSVEPEITPGEARAIWDSPDWSRGDVMVLFRHAVDVNNRGLDVPFTESD